MSVPGSTVLVVTSWFDPTADMVMEHLNKRGVPVFRVDPGDLPGQLIVTGELGPGGFATRLCLAERSLDLVDVGCGWYRRPTAFRFPPNLAYDDRRWASREARAGLGGLLQLVPRWLNHPAAIGRAEYKPIQLATARRVGLAVPHTLITNDPTRAAAFLLEVDGQAVYKPLASPLVTDADGDPGIVYTTSVTAEQVASPGVRLAPHLFQQCIAKDHELRVTYIDGVCHAARIDTNSQAAAADWRADTEHVTYRPTELAAPIATRVQALMDALDLRYGALDMIVDPDGQYWLLEVNPNGQFGFIEHTTGLPLSAAIADALTTTPEES